MRLFYFISILGFLAVAGFLAFEIAPHYLSFEPAPKLICGTPDGPMGVPLSETAEKARPIFKQNCARCHAPNFKVASTGPALFGLMDRIPNREWVGKFLRDPVTMYETDPYARLIHEQYPNPRLPHPTFSYLTDEEVDLLLQLLSE